MNKYLLTSFYLLVMFAIYQHPITLPNEGASIPTNQEHKLQKSSPKTYAFQDMTQKTSILSKEKQKTAPKVNISKRQK